MPQITNALRKIVRSLAEAKSRREYGLFVAEGTKCVSDTIPFFNTKYIFAKKEWLESNKKLVDSLSATEIYEATAPDMERMTQLSTPPKVIAVLEIPEYSGIDIDFLSSQLVVGLDRIQDPGNLGTIIRLCDWMGVTTILASKDTVDVWSPKVVQATMGAISRVNVIYCDLADTISKWKAPVYGTFLDAPDIYSSALSANGVVIFGNEGKGISDQISDIITHRLYIPSFPPERLTSESLNVATAAAIVLSQFRSRQLHSRN